ncbi:S66 peptidase family protein [Bradyrhizobium sp. HKCCYLRH1062]|uniref:S66 peptidase family protein n=1 Tax=unclassified Bradyrhizobium TaxID=2631580 RepID=UPI003EBA0996
MLWPTVKDFGSRRVTAGLVTLGAPEAAKNPENVDRAIAWLKEKHVDVRWAPNALGDGTFLAAAPSSLANDLHTMLGDPAIDLIITTGGGTNANGLLEFLDPRALASSPKPIIGLSNSTVVLNALTAASNVMTFHGPVLVWNFGSEDGIDEYTFDHLVRAVGGPPPVAITPEPSWRWLRSGVATGPTWGGNLWSFQQLLGTRYLPPMKGSVLFIEECFTELHNVEAMLTHLKTANVLTDLAGLIVGVPLECTESEMPDGRDFDDIVAGVCDGLGFPIVAGVNLGHTDRKTTIPIGAVAHLNSSANRLSFEVT